MAENSELRGKILEWRNEKYYRADAGIPIETEEEFEVRKLKELDQILAGQ